MPLRYNAFYLKYLGTGFEMPSKMVVDNAI